MTVTVNSTRLAISVNTKIWPSGKRLSSLVSDIDRIPAGTRRCSNVRFWLYFGRNVGKRCHNVVTILCFRRHYYDEKLTLIQRRVFDVGFPTDINVAASSWSCCFPNEILKVFQYHYNFFFQRYTILPCHSNFW